MAYIEMGVLGKIRIPGTRDIMLMAAVWRRLSMDVRSEQIGW